MLPGWAGRRRSAGGLWGEHMFATMANVVDALRQAIDALGASDNPDDLALAFGQLDRLRAVLVGAVAEFDAAERWRCDGATSAVAWLRGRARMGAPAAAALVSQARRLGSLPITAAAGDRRSAVA